MKCKVCGRETETAEASFCPFCGASLSPVAELPDHVKEWLSKAEQAEDYHLKAKILEEASKAIPDCFEIEWERLFIGHERPEKNKIDFSIIKCYLLQMYLTPKDFSPQRMAENRLELFEDPQLLYCLRLSSDPEKAMTDYLRRLSGDFIHIFLQGSNVYMQNFLGFTIGRNTAKLLAKPASVMLKAIEADGLLPSERREKLRAAFYNAFSEYTKGQTQWLDEWLSK